MNPILDFVRAIADFLEHRRTGDECRREPMLPVQPPGPGPHHYEQPIAPIRDVVRVGAWAGSAMLADPERIAAAAADLRLDEVHFMLGDHSACQLPMPFMAPPPGGGRAVASHKKLEALAAACQRSGVRLGITTWVMPHDQYATECGRYLRDAVAVLSAYQLETTIILDAEEPWTQASGAGPRAWRAQADTLRFFLEPLKRRGARIGLTGIGYARESALDPLAEFCDLAIPQVYCTTRNRLDPHLSPARFAKRWTAMFEAKKMAIGLAAYRQPKGGMTAALEAVRGIAKNQYTAECDEVIYWSLPNILASKARRAFVAGIKVTR